MQRNISESRAGTCYFTLANLAVISYLIILMPPNFLSKASNPIYQFLTSFFMYKSDSAKKKSKQLTKQRFHDPKKFSIYQSINTHQN
jgi:hypothetical protein